MTYLLTDKNYQEVIDAKTLGEAIGFYIDNRSDVESVNIDRDLEIAYFTQVNSVAKIMKHPLYEI